LVAQQSDLVAGIGAWLSSFTLAATEVSERAKLPWLTLSWAEPITNRGFRPYALVPVLAERRRQAAGTLSGSEQQMLSIERGLVSSPRLLMLDEPSMGLAPTMVDVIFEAVHALHRREGLTILILEQRAIEAIDNCDRGYVLSTGEVVGERYS
jgi:ABC-type branched-subunit amino acid transport system ATPase component